MIKVREARKRDLEKIKEMNWKFLNFYIDNKLDTLMVRDQKARIWGRKFVDKTFKNKNWKYFVAEDNHNIIGFINGNITKCPPIFKQSRSGNIWLVFVEDSYRRKGVGRILIKKFVEWVKKNKVNIVETNISPFNKISKKIFESIGFREIDIKYRYNDSK